MKTIGQISLYSSSNPLNKFNYYEKNCCIIDPGCRRDILSGLRRRQGMRRENQRKGKRNIHMQRQQVRLLRFEDRQVRVGLPADPRCDLAGAALMRPGFPTLKALIAERLSGSFRFTPADRPSAGFVFAVAPFTGMVFASI